MSTPNIEELMALADRYATLRIGKGTANTRKELQYALQSQAERIAELETEALCWKICNDRTAEAVKLPDESIENFMPRVGGKPFRCGCGCNVFHKPDRKHPEIYECNGCEARYEGT